MIKNNYKSVMGKGNVFTYKSTSEVRKKKADYKYLIESLKQKRIDERENNPAEYERKRLLRVAKYVQSKD